MIYDSLMPDGSRDYDAYSLADLPETIAKSVRGLKSHTSEFDTIVCIGLSGVTVAVPVALKLKKPVAILRKKGEDSHQGSMCGGIVNRYEIEGKRCLFLDDFKSGGGTESGVIQRVKEHGGEVVASWWYRDSMIVHHNGSAADVPKCGDQTQPFTEQLRDMGIPF